MGNVNINQKLQFLSTKYYHTKFSGSRKKKKRMKICSKKTLLIVTIMVADFLPHQHKFCFENGVFQQKTYLNKDFFNNPIHLSGM